jgi:hypothetical protein
MANKYEDWRISLNEENVAEIYEVSAPGYALRSRMKAGVNATLGGRECKMKTYDSLFSSKRRVEFSFPSRNAFIFRKSGFRVKLEDGDRKVLAARSHGRWTVGSNIDHLYAIFVFEFADLRHLLVNPILRNL